jgi:peptidase C39-like protein
VFNTSLYLAIVLSVTIETSPPQKGGESYGDTERKESVSLSYLNKYSCGQQALYLAARSAGHQLGLGEVFEALPFASSGCSMEEIYEAAESSGLNPCYSDMKSDFLSRIDDPLIFHRKDHYYVAIPSDSGAVVVMDSTLQRRNCTPSFTSGITRLGIEIPMLHRTDTISVKAALVAGALIAVMAYRWRPRSRDLGTRRT